MNRSQTVAVADAMCAIQPQWKQGGCISQLQVLAHTWQGTDAELAAHALLVAGDPTAQTPAAINNTVPTPSRAAAHHRGRQKRKDACSICGNTRSVCEANYDFEITEGIPDPHEFLTIERAEGNASRRQIDAKIRARADLEEARRKVAWQDDLDPELIDRRIQEPQPEETQPA